jgi:ribonuclease PH
MRVRSCANVVQQSGFFLIRELTMRPNKRRPDELRPLTFETGFTRTAPGSVLVRMGSTTVLCTCCVENTVPEFLVGKNKGWLTAEYAMLPGSTQSRKQRDKAGKVDGRGVEIQRLIGRSLRAIVNLDQLGERTLWLDCDVLEADAGTRTAAINGAYVALILALRNKNLPADAIVSDCVAAISVGIVDGQECLDLEYTEDRDADVDANIVMTGSGRLIEVQGTGEETTFSREQLNRMLDLAHAGIQAIAAKQRSVLGLA